MSVTEAINLKANTAFVRFVEGELKRRNWSVRGLATRMGVKGTSSVQRVVEGRARATPKTLARLASALDKTPEELAQLYPSADQPVKRRRAYYPAALAALPDEPPSRVQIEAARQVEPPRFSLTSNGTRMHLRLNLPDIPFEQAFKIVDVLRAIGMFTSEVRIDDDPL